MGSVFVESVVQLMLSHMTHTVYRPHGRVLLLPFAAAVYTTYAYLHPLDFSDPSDIEGLGLIWRLLCGGMGLYAILHLVAVVLDLMLILGVDCFAIPYPPPSHAASNGLKEH